MFSIAERNVEKKLSTFTRVQDFNKIPSGMKNYILNIKHNYTITQYYINENNFRLKLEDYSKFKVIKSETNKKTDTFILNIEGYLYPNIRLKHAVIY